MPNIRIKPFRDIDEHDVINLFAYDLSSGDKGTIVVPSVGWTNEDNLGTSAVVPGNSYANTVSNRWNTPSRVTMATTGTQNPLGILLYDIRETDENGELLIFRPQKAAEMQVALSGQTVPIATRGLFLVSGAGGTPGINSGAYVGASGILTATVPTTGSNGVVVSPQVGTFLGAIDTHGYALVRLKF